MTHKDYLATLGMEFEIARIRSGMSTELVSKITGLHTGTINQLEGGKKDFKILTAKRIADALGISLKDIL